MNDAVRSNLPWAEQFRITALAWLDEDNAARLLEETKSTELEERKNVLIQEDPKMSDAAAERLVKSSPGWKERIEKGVLARTKANRLRLKLDYIKMRHTEQQSFEATKRAEMKL